MTTIVGKLLAAALIVSSSAPALAGEVGHREANQHARIAQGIEHGRLTPYEAARLEHREGRIHRQVRSERARPDGHLTRGERRQVNHEQTRVSRQIYRAKHDGRHA
ncbi:MAG TPA: hypothetical protein VF400_17575 [Anaeromyxobacteraceae bacterium]